MNTGMDSRKVTWNLENHYFHSKDCKNRYFQPPPKNSPNVFENVFKMVQTSRKYLSGCIVEKTIKQRAKSNAHFTKSHPPRVSHERGFRIVKCIEASLWAHWAPRPLTHSSKTPPNHDCLLICGPSGKICHGFAVHVLEIARRFRCSLLRAWEWMFTETCKWNKQRTPFRKGKAAGLREALLVKFH